MQLEPKIVILLSTYNGEDYLAEQLDSLLKQTYSNFIIIIRDDASTDSSEQIINHYEERNQGKIHKLSGTNSNVCLLYTSPRQLDLSTSRIPSSA